MTNEVMYEIVGWNYLILKENILIAFIHSFMHSRHLSTVCGAACPARVSTTSGG